MKRTVVLNNVVAEFLKGLIYFIYILTFLFKSVELGFLICSSERIISDTEKKPTKPQTKS